MEAIQNVDFTILNFIRDNMSCHFLNYIMPIVSKLGNHGYIWIVVAFAFLLNKKYRTDGVMLLLSLVFCIIFGNYILKPLVGRIRPCDVNTAISLLIARPKDFSFPSGHTMSSFAAAMIIFNANKKMGFAAFGMASLIAFSRLYLYVHYPTDILGGIVFGLLISLAVIYLYKANEGCVKHPINEEIEN